MDRLRLVLLICLFSAPIAAARAERPRVHFDMPFAVACRDVTPPELAASHPRQRLVEVRFEISSLLLAGKESDLAQYFIRIDSPQRTLEVVDYLPQTFHESRWAGPIGVTTSDERNASMGINLSGKYEVFSSVSAATGLGQKRTESLKYDLLPPMETVAASGTLLRGSGVYFKLKASPRRPLEGATGLALVLRVPSEWRADYLRVHCEAEAIERGLVSALNQTVKAGQRDFFVALYLEGDEEARQTAEQFARRETSLQARAGK